MTTVYTVLEQSEDEASVLIAYTQRDDAVRCAHALADQEAGELRRFDEEMLGAPVAPDLYQVVVRKYAGGLRLSTVHAVLKESGSSTR